MNFMPGDSPPFYDPTATNYVGKQKGMKQVAYERGLYSSINMRKTHDNPDLSLEFVLGNCADFKGQRSELQVAIEERGHQMALSPKFHCELAGVGIEYSWGKAKQYFRMHSTGQSNDITVRIDAAISQTHITLGLVRKYARICRDYMRGYIRGNTGPAVEAYIKTRKTHRSALDMHFAIINNDDTTQTRRMRLRKTDAETPKT